MSIEFVEIRREINDGHLIKFIFLLSGQIYTHMTLRLERWQGNPSQSDATSILQSPVFYCPIASHSKLNIYSAPQRGGKAKDVFVALNKQTVNSLKFSLGRAIIVITT